MLKAAALVPYHVGFCAGQRFRVELWARRLAARNIQISFLPFSRPSLTDSLYLKGHYALKGVEMARCYAEQLWRVATHPAPDVVYIYREAALIGPDAIERLTRRWRAPVIYDLDEPLFIPHPSASNGLLTNLRFPSKVDRLMQMSDHVMVVNEMLRMYASRYAGNVSVVPMAVDTHRYRPSARAPAASPLRVGWVGTFSSQVNLQDIVEPMARLGRTLPCTLRVVADRPVRLPGVDVEFLPWSFDTEVQQLQECHIGVVPVQPDHWSPWKFYFKLIQFMGLGLPVVAASIGSNVDIVQDGVNGFLARNPDEWHDRLRLLAGDPALRRAMGEAARATVEAKFGLDRQVDQVEALFRGQADGSLPRRHPRPGGTAMSASSGG